MNECIKLTQCFIKKTTESPMPENWCVKITEENRKYVQQWFNEPHRYYTIGYYYGMIDGHQCTAYTLSHKSWTEISTEIFYKYILSMQSTKKIKYYKLIKPEYEPTVAKILRLSGNEIYGDIGSTEDIETLKKAGVLDIWFDPVYEEEKINISGYNLEVVDNKVKFGCAEFDKKTIEGLCTFIATARKSHFAFSYSESNGFKLSHGSLSTDITTDMFRKILSKLS